MAINHMTVNVRLPHDIHQKLRDAAKKHHQSMSALCISIIEDYIENGDRPRLRFSESPQALRTKFIPPSGPPPTLTGQLPPDQEWEQLPIPGIDKHAEDDDKPTWRP